MHKDKQDSVNLKQNTKDQNNNANDEVASPTSEQNAAIDKQNHMQIHYLSLRKVYTNN